MKKKHIVLISLASLLSLLPSCNSNNDNYLTFIALNDDSNFICTRTHDFEEDKLPSIYYSKDQKTWIEIAIEDETKENTPFVKLNKNEKIYLRGNNPNGISIAEDKFVHFSCIDSNYEDLTFSSSGSIMSLIDNGSGTVNEIPCDYCFTYMFGGTDYTNCKLTNSPKLPATKLKPYCYDHMFFDNDSLTTSSELPSLDIQEKCYAYMFAQCVSLKNSPALKATVTAPYCYDHMFYGNSSLESIEIYITDWDEEGNYPCCFWVSWDGSYPMSTKGTFKCPKELIPDITLLENFNESKVPYHWTIETF